MKLLLLSDKECPYLWDHYRPGMLRDYDLMLSCGDLKPEYLSFLVTMGRAPLLYVHGNHDLRYKSAPPEGCDCVEDKLVTVKGLRILGMGGSAFYGGREYQYTERQMERRLKKAAAQIRRAGGVDILLTHAPARGCGDADDYAHRGFECFLDFMDRYKPACLVHGHVHMNYGSSIIRETSYGSTRVINAYERHVLEL